MDFLAKETVSGHLYRIEGNYGEMKVALVSTGLGRILRGFESFTESLFQALRANAPEMDVTLFQGGGKSGERRHVIPNFHRYDPPAQWLGYEKGNMLEKRSFALALYALLRRGQFNIVHYNELVMGSALYHLRRLLGGDFKLLYCNGGPAPPILYHHRCDYAQMLHGPMYEEAKSFGMKDDKLFLLPYGVNSDRFSPEVKSFRNAVRRELEIPDGAKVIFTAAALNCGHKRIDYLIREVGRLPGGAWLVAAGQRTEETVHLEKIAERLIPRFRITNCRRRRRTCFMGADTLC
jgi:glycosyltransferase involved in cell wall biosynthesis